MALIWCWSVMISKCSIVEAEDMISADLRAFRPCAMLVLPQIVIATVMVGWLALLSS